VRASLDGLAPDAETLERIAATARTLVDPVWGARPRPGGIDAFLAEQGLSTQQWVLLVGVKEALLRRPRHVPRTRG